MWENFSRTETLKRLKSSAGARGRRCREIRCARGERRGRGASRSRVAATGGRHSPRADASLRPCAACSHCRAAAWELSGHDRSHAATPQLCVSRALHLLSFSILCSAPPAVDLLEALGRCVCARRACCFCLRCRLSP